MAKEPDPLGEVVDTSYLTDADWAEINKLRATWRSAGQQGLSKALAELSEVNPIRYIHVVGAYFPDMVAETIKDAMAEKGMTEEDLQDLVRKLKNPANRAQ